MARTLRAFEYLEGNTGNVFSSDRQNREGRIGRVREVNRRQRLTTRAALLSRFAQPRAVETFGIPAEPRRELTALREKN